MIFTKFTFFGLKYDLYFEKILLQSSQDQYIKYKLSDEKYQDFEKIYTYKDNQERILFEIYIQDIVKLLKILKKNKQNNCSIIFIFLYVSL